MVVSEQEVQSHIADLRKDLATAVKRARHSDEAKREVVSLRKQIKGLTRVKKAIAKRDAKRK
jgi:hypothetical protein